MSDFPFYSKKENKNDNSIPFFMRLYPPLQVNEQSDSKFKQILKLDLS